MSDTLYNIYKEAAGEYVETVYVFPRIDLSSKYNPYLSLLYKDLTNINVESVNPLIPKFIIRKIKGENSIVHYHWLEFCNLKELIILLYKLSLLFIYLMAGGKIVWTMHNLAPHCKKFQKGNLFFRKWMIRTVKFIILHSEQAKPAVSSYYRIPSKMIRVVPHPKYPVTIEDREKSIEKISRKYKIKLNKSQPIFLIYGRISQYKGILEVVKVFIKNEYQLIIAGDTAKESSEYVNIIKELSNKTKNITLINKFIPSNEESFLFGASDICIFNFSKMLSSGSILLADSYQKDIIAPASAKKLTDNNNINTFSNHEELCNTIDKIYKEICEKL